ncbi:hypothetical protein CAL26_13185 [Bordetella genomosp. 9]|uniref:Phosphate transporter n=1 Tax=Bordetella genomosp. 9 TaxID=1416803 RepID=A0A261R0U3_9BORD|nr:hypothetical protein [Bordetella genomosp. 9]OZI18658.1 hypothetical protein CAL26_13185 [Bordetella genomosp. 9]
MNTASDTAALPSSQGAAHRQAARPRFDQRTGPVTATVAGTMAANRSGLQLATLRNLALAWVLTLPAAMLLSGLLYWALRHLF